MHQPTRTVLWAGSSLLAAALLAGPASAGTTYTSRGQLTADLNAQYGGAVLIDFEDFPLALPNYGAFSDGHQIGAVTFDSLSLEKDINLQRPVGGGQTPTGLFGTFLVDDASASLTRFVRPGGQGPTGSAADDDDFALDFAEPVPGAGLFLGNNTAESGDVETVTFFLFDSPPVTVDFDGGDQFTGFLADDPSEYVVRIEVREGSLVNDDIFFDNVVYGLLGDAPRVVGETGLAQVGDTPTDISFLYEYIDPVVFVSPVADFRSDIALARVTDVRPDGFSVKVHNQPGLPPSRASETLHWMVVEAGQWQQDGHLFEVGHVVTGAWVTNHLSLPPTGVAWAQPAASSPFDDEPLLFTQVQTEMYSNWVGTRQHRIALSAPGTLPALFFAMEGPEGQMPQPQEKIGWLLVEHTMPWAGVAPSELTDAWTTVLHPSPMSTEPRLLANIATRNLWDNAHLRYRNLDGLQVDLRVEEDTVFDLETTHSTGERVNLIVLEDGFLFAQPQAPAPSFGN